MVNKELQEEVSLKIFKLSNSKLSWLGDLYTTPTYPLLFCIDASKIMNSLKFNALTIPTPTVSF